MTPVLIDLALLCILVFCVWHGGKRGLVLTVAGVAAVILSAFFAGRIASAYASPVSDSIYPLMSWVAEDALEETIKGKGRLAEITDQSTLSNIAQDVYKTLGIHNSEVKKMVTRSMKSISEDAAKAQDSITHTVVYAFSYMLLAVFSFGLLMVGFHLLINFIASVRKLPFLNQLDKTGGVLLGLLYGLLLLSAVGWGARFLGIVINPELLSRTVLLKFFVNVNLLSPVLGF